MWTSLIFSVRIGFLSRSMRRRWFHASCICFLTVSQSCVWHTTASNIYWILRLERGVNHLNRPILGRVISLRSGLFTHAFWRVLRKIKNRKKNLKLLKMYVMITDNDIKVKYIVQYIKTSNGAKMCQNYHFGESA